MQTVKDEIGRALKALSLSPGEFRVLPDVEAQAVCRQTTNNLVEGSNWRWWWEHFRFPYATWHCTDSLQAYKELPQILGTGVEHVWFIAEETLLPFYPVYEGTVDAIVRILGECYGFEYYVVDKNYRWIVCENHHDMMLASGSPVKEALDRFIDS